MVNSMRDITLGYLYFTKVGAMWVRVRPIRKKMRGEKLAYVCFYPDDPTLTIEYSVTRDRKPKLRSAGQLHEHKPNKVV